jgi:hypothetical protein
MEGIPLFQWKESLYFNGKNPSTSIERIPLFQWKEVMIIILIMTIIIIMNIIERTLNIPLFQWKASLYFNGKHPSISMEGIPLFQWKGSLYFNGKNPSISIERNDNDNQLVGHGEGTSILKGVRMQSILGSHFQTKFSPVFPYRKKVVVGRIKFFHTKMPIFWLFFVINFVCLLM